ncbi:MAG: penicillin acylase family protein, partial [Chloroflexota bacterium]|nr:penicillin acylase family protein [Chloroflexota bacterium]
MRGKTRYCLRLAVVVICMLLALPPSPALAEGGSHWETLLVDGETARIFRDDYGVPHISAPSNRALFYAYGYAVAQDRLWQLDIFRRAARGTLAEVAGSMALDSDRHARRHGYTEAEYQALFDKLTPEAQEILTAYGDGINAYLDVVLADRDKLPWEFHQLGYDPAYWQETDTLAISRFMANRWGEKGGRELQNQALLQSLVSTYGESVGRAMFEDLRWLNDPEAPVSVPVSHEVEALAALGRPLDRPTLPGVEAVARAVDAQRKAARDVWEKYGIPTKLGSYAWAVGPSRSASGHAMLLGGPQMGWDAPDIVHEVQLTGGQGFDVIGVAFAGTPMVSIGHNRSVAWTVTSGMGDNVDIYVESLNPLDAEQYWYDDAWRTMITRTETIPVRWGTPAVETVRRTVHGPVFYMDAANNLAYSMRRAHWMREDLILSGMLSMARAENLAEFEAGVQDHQVSNNILYADVEGNIAYWQAGAIPIRPDGGHVGRFPWRGDGTEEWQDEVRAIPHAVNPEQGYLVNWNNKACADFDNGDTVLLGKQDRVLEIEEILAADESVSWEEMKAIPVEIAAFELMGDETRYLLPYLLAAI